MPTTTNTGTNTGTPGQGQPHLKPGDQAMEGTPGTGEDLCEECGGTGVRKDGNRCPNCEGTGRVTHGIGGA